MRNIYGKESEKWRETKREHPGNGGTEINTGEKGCTEQCTDDRRVPWRDFINARNDFT